MQKILLVDDEPDARNTLKIFLHDFFPHLKLIYEAESVASAIKMIAVQQPDILFLDINLQADTALTILETIKYNDFAIIFVTAYDDFAVRAFRYNAIDYLLKPIDPEEFCIAVKKALSKMNRRQMAQHLNLLKMALVEKKLEHLVINHMEGFEIIPIKEVVYLRSDGNYTHIYFETGKNTMATKLIKEFQELLPASQFFRVHQSYIVNRPYIRRYIKKEDSVQINDSANTLVPVSRRRKDDFMAWINSYSG